MSVPTEIAPPESPLSKQLSSPARTGERFLRADRLLRRAEFVRVQQQGRRVHSAHFIVLMLRGSSEGTRLGVTVGRRVGGAVQRNRIKRLVREVFRRNRELFPAGCDVVLVARVGADRLDYASVQSELARAQTAIERLRKQLWSTSQPAKHL